MTKRISLRWKLILVAWSLAFAVGSLLLGLLHLRNERHLREQLEKTLETKCDEVITVLQRREPFSVIEQFFFVETEYRFSPYTYFYQINDDTGQVLARSENLGESLLPLPRTWERGDSEIRIHLESVPHPLMPHHRVRVRSERVDLMMAGGERRAMVIQTAGSLAPLETAVHQTLREALLVTACALGGVLFLLWFVTTRSLRPVAGITRTASEITARNLRERLPLTGSGDELDELARVLNGMLDRLASSLRRIEEFSSDAAHQLRTPLTRIRGELDLMLRSDASTPLRSEIEDVQGEVERLGRLCGRLLLLARLDQRSGGGRVSDRESVTFDQLVDLEDLVCELLEQLAPVARERGVELRRAAMARTFVRANRSLLVEALMNLLDNAIRITPVGSSITLSVDAAGGETRVSVEDDGPGVPPEERDRIFQRFYRIPGNSRDENGSGLGLAIVRSIARAHRGRVEVADRPGGGGGSVFRLVLPICR